MTRVVGYIHGPHVGEPLDADERALMRLMVCDGRRLPTAGYEALYGVLGCLYGGPRWRSWLPGRLGRWVERSWRPRWFRIPDLTGRPRWFRIPDLTVPGGRFYICYE